MSPGAIVHAVRAWAKEWIWALVGSVVVGVVVALLVAVLIEINHTDHIGHQNSQILHIALGFLRQSRASRSNHAVAVAINLLDRICYKLHC